MGRRPSNSCASVSKNTSVDLCSRQVLFEAVFSLWLLTRPARRASPSPGSPGAPKNFRQSQWSLGKDCSWPSSGRLWSFQNGTRFSPQTLLAAFCLPHSSNHPLGGSSPQPKSHPGLLFPSLTSTAVSPLVEDTLQSVSGRELLFSIPTAAISSNKLYIKTLLPTHLLSYKPFLSPVPKMILSKSVLLGEKRGRLCRGFLPPPNSASASLPLPASHWFSLLPLPPFRNFLGLR